MDLHRVVRRALVAGAVLGTLTAATPAGADEKFSDTTCPGTVPSVIAFTAAANARPIDPPTLLAAARTAGDNYEICAEQLRTDQRIEPQAHYAQFRAAQHYVVAARVEIQLEKFEDARKHLAIARQDATDVAGWQPFGSGSATKHSVWAEKSTAILAAVDETAKNLPARDVPKPTSAP